MINEEFRTIGLYDHNAESYKKVIEAFESGEDVVGIVHATGTGKSYNALQLAFNNKDKKIVYVVPSNGIIEHLKKIIDDNPNLELEKDFPNLEFRTYQSFISLSKEEIANIECDMLILDEFHHIGAPVWGARIDTMIETHHEMKIFGMTAYTVRDRGTAYERDMANPDTDELFSRKIASRYDLCDAMIDGVLPKPVYKSAYVNLLGTEQKLEERVQSLEASSKEYQEYMAILNEVKKRIQEAPSIPNILKKSIKPDGKYIYFCPPCSEQGTNDIETIKKQAIEWFKQFIPEEDIVIYTTTSEMGDEGKKNRDAFYDDVSLDGKKVDDKFRIMFAINQYNEGIHAPNIDGVIMSRGTTSDIVYFEQLGRALSVRGDTKEMFDKLENCTVDHLIELCKSREIPIKDGATKEELIEKLIAPIIIDLTNNYDFIKELEDNLKDRIKEIQNRGLGFQREIKIRNASFDIEIENQDLFEMLKYVRDRLTRTWEDNYKLAESYFKNNGDLLIPALFKTFDGYSYDENGINLGTWIREQRKKYDSLSKEQKDLLSKIGFIVSAKEKQWQNMYELAKKYYEHHKNLFIPSRFKTKDGVTYNENGMNLGTWIRTQRSNYESLSQDRKDSLSKIGFVINAFDGQWQRMYELAKKYYEQYKDILIPVAFKTKDGVTYDENGMNLGTWIRTQRNNYESLSQDRKDLLSKIGFIIRFNNNWQEMYKLAKKYYEHHRNLLVPYSFKTKDGYTYDENGMNLGIWISGQRTYYGSLGKDRKDLLSKIGFVNSVYENQWQEMYELAKKYYKHHNNLLISRFFKTKDGYTYDENGINLGEWISTQRKKYNSLDGDRRDLLEQIGMVWNIKKNKEIVNEICAEHDIDATKNKPILDRISVQEMQSKIEFLKEKGLPIVDENGILVDIFTMSSVNMKEKYGLTLEEMITEYYFQKQKNIEG